ncbi:MepB protein, partial [Staphylococcus shinii]
MYKSVDLINSVFKFTNDINIKTLETEIF